MLVDVANSLIAEFITQTNANIVESLIAALSEDLPVAEMLVYDSSAPCFIDRVVQTKRGAKQIP